MGSIVLDALSRGTQHGCEFLLYETFTVCTFGCSQTGRLIYGLHAGWIIGALVLVLLTSCCWAGGFTCGAVVG